MQAAHDDQHANCFFVIRIVPSAQLVFFMRRAERRGNNQQVWGFNPLGLTRPKVHLSE